MMEIEESLKHLPPFDRLKYIASVADYENYFVSKNDSYEIMIDKFMRLEKFFVAAGYENVQIVMWRYGQGSTEDDYKKCCIVSLGERMSVYSLDGDENLEVMRFEHHSLLRDCYSMYDD